MILVFLQVKEIIAGNKKSNKKYFYNKYGVIIKFKSSNDDYILYKDKRIDFDINTFIKAYVEENYGGDLLLD